MANKTKQFFSFNTLVSVILICALTLQSSKLFDQTTPIRYLFLSILLLFAFIKNIQSKFDFNLNRSVIFLFVYFIVQSLSFAYANNTSLIYHELIITISLLIGIIVIPSLLNQNITLVNTITKTIVIVTILWNIKGIYDFYSISGNLNLPEEDSYLISSLFGNKNHYSSALVICLPLMVKSFINETGKWKTLTYIAINLTICLILLLETRSVYIILLLYSVIIISKGLMNLKSSQQKINAIIKKQKKWIFISLSFCCLIIILKLDFFNSYNTKKIETNNNQITTPKLNKSASINERLFLWNKTLPLVKEHFLLGVGTGNWKSEFNKNGVTNSAASRGNVVFKYPHNDFIGICAENGIIGFSFYCLFFIVIIFNILKDLKNNVNLTNNIIYLSGIVGYLIYSQFEYPKNRPEHLLILILYISLYFSHKYAIIKKHSITTRLNSLLVKSSFILIFGMCILYNIGDVRANYYYQKINENRIRSNWQNVNLLSRKINSSFFDSDMNCVPIMWHQGIANFSLGNYELAKKQLLQAYKSYPYNLHVINNLGSAYSLTSKNDSALVFYKKALAISAEFDDARINLCILLYQKNETKACMDELKKIKDPEILSKNLDFVCEIIKIELQKNISTLEDVIKELS